MRKLITMFLVVALGAGLLFYVRDQRKKLSEKANPEIIESIAIPDSSSASEATASAVAYKLRVLSVPAEAVVLMDGAEVGKTPFDMTVPRESKQMSLVLDGFENYSRQVPALKDAEGDLVWKIQLKKVSANRFKNLLFQGELKPFNVQLKAVPFAEFGQKLLEEMEGRFAKRRLQQKLKYCAVRIDGKVWVRVLLGGYPNKKTALSVLKSIKSTSPQAFVTQKQICLDVEKQ